MAFYFNVIVAEVLSKDQWNNFLEDEEARIDMLEREKRQKDIIMKKENKQKMSNLTVKKIQIDFQIKSLTESEWQLKNTPQI